MKHYSVLLNEAIDGLNLKEEGIYVDGTLGLAGHSKEILKEFLKANFMPLMPMKKPLKSPIKIYKK